MLVWAGLILFLVLFGATWLLGMIVILPLLGHATWHAYRDTVEKPTGQPDPALIVSHDPGTALPSEKPVLSKPVGLTNRLPPLSASTSLQPSAMSMARASPVFPSGIPGEAIAAEYLQRIAGDLERGLGGRHLGGDGACKAGSAQWRL